MIVALVTLSALLAVAAAYMVGYALHEWKWTRRERLIRTGGPADRNKVDRLIAHQIEPEHPDEHITKRPIEGKPYYQSDPTVWDQPKENP